MGTVVNNVFLTNSNPGVPSLMVLPGAHLVVTESRSTCRRDNEIVEAIDLSTKPC